MKVLQVIHVRRLAGAERLVLDLSVAMRASGIDVSVAMLDDQAKPCLDFLESLREAGVPVEHIEIPRITRLLFNPYAPAIIHKLYRLFKLKRADVVHTHMISADLYGIPAARLAGVKCVVSTRHNTNTRNQQFIWMLPALILRKLTSQYIAVSDAVAQIMEDEGIHPGTFTVIYNGIPVQSRITERERRREQLRMDLGLPEGALLIGTVGRLVPKKGHQYGIKAVAKICESIQNLHYLVIGDGELLPALMRLAVEAGVQENVHFLGWRKDIHIILDALDIFAFPSLLGEGLPISLLEAMRQRLPIVTTNIGPMPKIVIDGKTGFLVEPASADALVEPLVRLLKDPALAAKMGEAGYRRFLEEFTIDKNAARTIELYELLLQRDWREKASRKILK